MIISFLVGFGIGMLIGAVIDIVIDIYNEYLTSSKAKTLATEKTNKKITKIIVSNIQKNGEIGEVIDVKAFDEDNNHVANVTFNAQQGSSLITNNSY